MIILLVAAAVVVALPLIAAALVSIASRREDSGKTLLGRAPDRLDAAARRLLSVQSGGFSRRSGPQVPRRHTAGRDEADRHLTGPHA
jgi:hypothetical protein